MKTSYFTFGQTHAHSIGGFTFDRNIVVKITDENPRDVMFYYFGDKWAFEYNDKPDMRYFPRGIKNLTR